jgi:hypothetical protein
MSAPSQAAVDTAILAEVREALARPFGETLAARLPEVLEMLEQQLALTTERAKWKPLRAAAAAAPLMPEDYTATLHVSSAAATEEGFERGTWVEFTEPDGARRRCRLNWLSPLQGTCVFKDLEKNRSFAISLDELREKRRTGLAVIVEGAGVAQASIDGAIADVARGMGAS